MQQFFGVSYKTTRHCLNGHTLTSIHTVSPEVLLTINDADMQIAHHFVGDRVTTTTYFQYYIPRSRGGNHSGGTTPIHLLDTYACTKDRCSALAPIESISTLWPQILTINADIIRSDPHKLHYENTFMVPDENGSPVSYDLIGRVIHIDGNHFVSQVRCRGQVHTYNNMDGKLILSKNPHLLEVENKNSVCYVYSRTSANGKVNAYIVMTQSYNSIITGAPDLKACFNN